MEKTNSTIDFIKLVIDAEVLIDFLNIILSPQIVLTLLVLKLVGDFKEEIKGMMCGKLQKEGDEK